MVGGGSIGPNEVPTPEGEEELQESEFHFIYKHALFQSVVCHMKNNKMVDKPF